jgi:hypothetical protein
VAEGEEGLEYRIFQAFDDHLVIEALDDSRPDLRQVPLPSNECFPYAVSYKIRANSYWVLLGSESGFLHHRVEADDGSCAYEEIQADCVLRGCDNDEYLPEDEPMNRTDFGGDSRCLLDGRVMPGGPFANPFFCLDLYPAICGERANTFPECSGPDDIYATSRGSTYTFTVVGGFRGVRVDGGDLPRTMRINVGDGSMYVVDQSDLGLIEVDLETLTVVRNYY